MRIKALIIEKNVKTATKKKINVKKKKESNKQVT